MEYFYSQFQQKKKDRTTCDNGSVMVLYQSILISY
jgi:hypothetical protein